MVKNESGGVFITQRLAILRKKGINYRAVAIEFYDSFWIKTIRWMVRKVSANDHRNLVSLEHQKRFPFYLYEYYHLRRGLVDFVFKNYGEDRIQEVLRNAINERIDLIHAHWVYPHGYLAVRLGKEFHVPVVVTAHGSDVHSIPLKNERILKRVLYTLENADKVVFVSEALKRSAIDFGYSDRNSVVIPNGIDFEIINQSIEQPLEKDVLKLNSKHVVGFVGNLVLVKRADKLPIIFKKIAELIDVRFLIVGDGPLKDKIYQDCSDYELDVDFVGRIPHHEVFKYMSLMNVLILPSRKEGFGCVVIEAQACGIPVVGSNQGGIPEVIGDGGLVVPDGSCFEERFASEVVRVLQTSFDTEKLIRRVYKYDWQNIVSQEVRLYKDLLSSVSR